jgi:hypothetical protein
MALGLRYTFCEQCDCKVVLFNDSTGVYNVSTNPTGYGAPNIASTAITSAIISVTPPDYDDPIILTFTVSSGTITAATRTDIFGTVTNIISLLNTTVFPFVDLEIDSILLFGDSEQSLLTDGSWTVVYTVSDGVNVNQWNAFNYLICGSTKCRDEKAIGFINKTVSKADAMNVFLNYDALLVAVSMGDPTAVNSQVSALQSLCNPCNNC